MTHVHLTGTLPPATTQLQGVMQSTFPFEEPIALTFVVSADERSMTRWLVPGQSSPVFDLQSASTPVADTGVSALAQYVRFGFTHILPHGFDHVLFVLGLYLGARSFRSLLIMVTAFTLAHSITLGLATLSIITLPARIVEPLIAASIAWIGVENFFATSASRYRPFLVFGFGLLHGLGFASALSELTLPQTSFLAALLSFNFGIELGQLTVIALALGATVWFRKKVWYRSRVVLPASFAIAILAAFWTVQRILQ
jgi:hypothetical protein